MDQLEPNHRQTRSSSVLKADEDFYIEEGKYVFTAKYLLARGYCCGNGCRHCPYGNTPQRADISKINKNALDADSKF